MIRGTERWREEMREEKVSEKGEKERERPTLNYSKIRESVTNLLSLSECGGVISVKITLWYPPSHFFLRLAPFSVPYNSFLLISRFPIHPPRSLIPELYAFFSQQESAESRTNIITRIAWWGWLHTIILSKRGDIFCHLIERMSKKLFCKFFSDET